MCRGFRGRARLRKLSPPPAGARLQARAVSAFSCPLRHDTRQVLTLDLLLALAIEVTADWLPYDDAQVLGLRPQARTRAGTPQRGRQPRGRRPRSGLITALGTFGPGVVRGARRHLVMHAAAGVAADLERWSTC